MDASTGIPPIVRPRRCITYELTRGDLFATVMTICLRNRILQIFIPVGLMINLYFFLTRRPPGETLAHLISELISFVIWFFLVILFSQLVVAAIMAFVQTQRGVVGRHAMELADQGLIERTEVNETLHRWPSVTRVFSLFGYLYIYIGDNNSFAIPRRDFAPGELESFETEVRAFCE